MGKTTVGECCICNRKVGRRGGFSVAGSLAGTTSSTVQTTYYATPQIVVTALVHNYHFRCVEMRVKKLARAAERRGGLL